MMNKAKVVLTVLCSLLILGAVLFYLKIGWVMSGRQAIDGKRMGYCFDAATDQNGNRLFVAAGIRGMHIFNLNDGKMRYVTTYYDDGYYRNLKVREDWAFVADARRGLVVLNIREKMPVTTWVHSSSTAMGLHIKENKAYVAVSEQGLQIFDISTPDSPILLSTTPTPGDAWDIWVNNDFAYIADLHAGMTVVDISKPEEPQLVATVTWTKNYPMAEILRGDENFVYIAAGKHGMIVINISDPANPVVVSKYRPFRFSYAEGLAVEDGIVYLAMGSEFGNISSIENGLHIIDVSNPSSPRLVGKARFLDWVEGVHTTGDHAYVANTWNGIRSIDIRDPAMPILVDTFNAFP
jgi:hypothetical protein